MGLVCPGGGGSPPGWASAEGGGADEQAPVSSTYPPVGLSDSVRDRPRYVQLGCMDTPYYCTEYGATFGCDHDCPRAMPSLSGHNNHMAVVLRESPALWEAMRLRQPTRLGVTFADCIKTGVDNRGHPLMKQPGIVAGDEECYEQYREVFDPVIKYCHPGFDPAKDQHQVVMDHRKLSAADIDPTGRYVRSVRIHGSRGVRGFRLPPLVSFAERRQLEGLLVRALGSMQGPLEGQYFPLKGSRSYPALMGGMSTQKEHELAQSDVLPDVPTNPTLLAAGVARHWPDARGVFQTRARDLCVWVNCDEHLRVIAQTPPEDPAMPSHPTDVARRRKDVHGAAELYIEACTQLRRTLRHGGEGRDFMQSQRLGWLTADPGNVGPAFVCAAAIRLPHLSGRADWKQTAARMGLQAKRLGEGGVDWEVATVSRIGHGTVDLCNILIEGVAQLVRWEIALEPGAGDIGMVDDEMSKISSEELLSRVSESTEHHQLYAD